MEGMILKIDRCSKHDGPGLRTVIFLKGCPLRCQWCSTPESQHREPQLLHQETMCIQCGRCIESCTEKALKMTPDRVKVDTDRCTLCGKCVDACLNYAIKIVGKKMKLDEVYKIIDRSRQFWNRMAGGVTISGGEVFHQFEFTKAILMKCHNNSIDTNIETSAFTSEKNIREILPYLDHVCCDIKHMNEKKHIKLTGVSNKVILNNIKLISNKKDLIIRFPIIPTCNDSEDNIIETAKFVKNLGKKFNKIELIPYHQMGNITYKRLGYAYLLENIPEVTKEFMYTVRNNMLDFGVNVSIA